MSKAILIKPDDVISKEDYDNYKTINKLVEGWYEICSRFVVSDVMCFLFCNEEYLLCEGMKFNAIATLLTNYPVYGNVVLLEDGYNEEGEPDCLPLDNERANNIYAALLSLRQKFAPVLKELHIRYDKFKPEPQCCVMSMSYEEMNGLLGENKHERV